MDKIEIDLSLLTDQISNNEENVVDSISKLDSKDLIEQLPPVKIDESGVKPSDTKAVSNEKLKEIVTQLGLIHTNFPENESPEFEGRTVFPSSYNTLSPKERLLLLFAENFRRQFNELYPVRLPLVLAVANECGVQVCSFFLIFDPYSLSSKFSSKFKLVEGFDF